jgi:hydroxymethylbilane synthase
MAQLKTLRDDLTYMDIRGNVPTRIEKLDDGYCDAIVLAAAGLIRLGLEERITQFFDIEISLPIPGQGALGIECRTDDNVLKDKLNGMDDLDARTAVTAERSFLATIGGGCSMPIGAYAKLIGSEKLLLTACVTSLDGKEVKKAEMEAPASEAKQLGERLAKVLLEQGAQKIVEQLRKLSPVVVSPP